MYYLLTSPDHDSCNKLKHKLAIYNIARTHTQMRKSPRGEKKSGKEMRRDRVKKIRKRKKKEEIKENLKKERKKEIIKIKN